MKDKMLGKKVKEIEGPPKDLEKMRTELTLKR